MNIIRDGGQRYFLLLCEGQQQQRGPVLHVWFKRSDISRLLQGCLIPINSKPLILILWTFVTIWSVIWSLSASEDSASVQQEIIRVWIPQKMIYYCAQTLFWYFSGNMKVQSDVMMLCLTTIKHFLRGFEWLIVNGYSVPLSCFTARKQQLPGRKKTVRLHLNLFSLNKPAVMQIWCHRSDGVTCNQLLFQCVTNESIIYLNVNGEWAQVFLSDLLHLHQLPHLSLTFLPPDVVFSFIIFRSMSHYGMHDSLQTSEALISLRQSWLAGEMCPSASGSTTYLK